MDYLAHTKARYFTSAHVSDVIFTPSSHDTSTPVSNDMSKTNCVSHCTFRLVNMVALGVDVPNLENKNIYMAIHLTQVAPALL